MQLGVGELTNPRKWTKPQIGHCLKARVPPKKHYRDFEVAEENLLPIGYMISPAHFKVGQWVDVKGTSRGKGFAGTIKRWNFSQQNNSHGNSKAHRKPGSIGHSEYPGRVFPGKKMAGRLGGDSATQHALRVIKFDIPRSLLYLKGPVPGAVHSLVSIRDSQKRIDKQYLNLHYPTFIPGDEYPVEEMWQPDYEDPMEVYPHENADYAGKDGNDE